MYPEEHETRHDLSNSITKFYLQLIQLMFVQDKQLEKIEPHAPHVFVLKDNDMSVLGFKIFTVISTGIVRFGHCVIHFY
jgi:hypothetical protein